MKRRKLADLAREAISLARNAETNGHHEEYPGDPMPADSFEPFPLSALPQPLRDYADAGARAIDADPSFVAIPLLVTMAGAIGNTRRLQLKRGWEEPAILWAAIVGESGTHKSPGTDLAKKFPRRRQELALRRHEAVFEEYQHSLACWEKEQGQWKKSKTEGDPPQKPDSPTCERCLCDDITIESLAPILRDNWRGVTILRDELASWLGAFDRYSGRNKPGSDAAKWIEMHGGRPVIIDRKSGTPPTIYVPRAAVNIAGGIQPGTLRRAIGQEHRENGLLARLLLAWPPRRAKRWTDADVDPSLVGEVQAVYDRLFELGPEKDEDGFPSPVPVTLTPEAKSLFVAFVNEHGQEQAELVGDLAAAWSKLEGYAARLALVHHLVRHAANEGANPVAVDEISMVAGITLSRWFGGEARRVYLALGAAEGEQDRSKLLDLIRRHGGKITVRDLQRSGREWAAAEKAEAALAVLVNGGIGSWEITQPSNGRPSRVFRLRNAVDS